MKYWVYKESRVLGPFDKEAVSGFPGLDSGTLVCAGDPAGGSWVPAGELEGLTRIPAGPPAGLFEDLPSSESLLDQLQIDAAGLLGDDDFPASFSDELFQDAGFKKDFKDLLTDRISPDESAIRRAKETISTLTAQLETMYRRVSELEAGQTDMARRLASRDAELLARPQEAPPQAEAPSAAKTFLSPAPPPIPGGPPPVAAVQTPPPAEPVAEWPETPAAGTGGFPSFSDGLVPPPAPAAPALPDMPSFASSEAPPPLELETHAPAAPKPLAFPKPKSFKIVPTLKSFKVVGPEHASPAAAQNPVPEFKFEEPAVVPPPPAPEPVAAVPPPPAFTPPPPAFAAPVQLSPAPVPIPIPVPEPAPITNPFALPARPELAPLSSAAATPVPPPPNTLSRSQPVPDPAAGSEGTEQLPPQTMARSAVAAAFDEPAADGAAARFAKPEPAPATGEIKKPARNNKVFLIAAGALLVLLMIVGVIFMRQPKDDLKQMTTLDDGKAPLGVPADEGAAAPPPIVKPRIAPEPPPQAPAPPPGPSPEHQAAIEAVKDFPLDGGRGTVGRWLQYSYTASPGAGTEEWNASSTGDNTILVEYRLVPGATGGAGALYLFEVDSIGIVKGKNIEARRMLAGGPPPDAPKAKKKPAKKAPKRRAAVETPKEVPLLPLPDSGELRPPAEDDGSFGSDTINSGI